MVRYMKCPRCELNYIDAEKQDYCDVCLKEMKGIPSEADELEEAEEIATELCPICGENMMRAGEKMCDECRRKADYEAEEPDPENDEDDEWRNYLEDADDELDAEKSTNRSRASSKRRSPKKRSMPKRKKRTSST